jgi:hypothetical protein
MDVVCVGVLPKMVVREVVAVADARQVIMLMLSIGHSGWSWSASASPATRISSRIILRI